MPPSRDTAGSFLFREIDGNWLLVISTRDFVHIDIAPAHPGVLDKDDDRMIMDDLTCITPHQEVPFHHTTG